MKYYYTDLFLDDVQIISFHLYFKNASRTKMTDYATLKKFPKQQIIDEFFNEFRECTNKCLTESEISLISKSINKCLLKNEERDAVTVEFHERYFDPSHKAIQDICDNFDGETNYTVKNLDQVFEDHILEMTNDHSWKVSDIIKAKPHLICLQDQYETVTENYRHSMDRIGKTAYQNYVIGPLHYSLVMITSRNTRTGDYRVDTGLKDVSQVADHSVGDILVDEFFYELIKDSTIVNND